jgi:hypothetical protein
MCVSSGGVYIIWRCVYHLEVEGIICSRSLSSGGLCIIWRGRISSKAEEYHLEGRVSSGVSSGRVCIIWKGRVSSGAGEYHLEGYVSSGRDVYHLE